MNSAAAEGVPFVATPGDDVVGSDALRASWWPYARLAEGLEELARRAGLHPEVRETVAGPPIVPCTFGETDRWIRWAAEQLGVEAESVDATVPDLPALLVAAGPVIAATNDARGPGFYLLLRATRRIPRLLGPDLRVRRCPLERLRAALCWRCESPLVPGIERLIDEAGIAPARRARIRAALLAERIVGERIGPFWMLRLPASADFGKQLIHEGIRGRAVAMLAVFALVYVLEIAGWRVIGAAALDGNLDPGWFVAWVLLMVSLVPLRLVGRWVDATVTLVAGRLLKSRLLIGALRTDLESVRHQGAGQLLARVMESQSLEALALDGGMTALTSVVELAFAGWLLAIGAGGAVHLALLGACLVFVAVNAWRYHRRLHAWTVTRLNMTSELVERMVGHRTCLAQEVPGRRDAREDHAIKGYVADSKAMDGAVAPVLAGGPALWLLVGIAGLAPAFGSGSATPASLAIGLGGVLFAQRALGGLAGCLASAARAVVAWEQVGPLFRSGRVVVEARPFVATPAGDDAAGARTLVEGRGLRFGYAAGNDVLHAVDLHIERGERLLVEGASGGGKSTLASLLTGLRTPSAGLLLLGGVDRHTLGDEWHRIATSAPQFHENHVLSGTFAFNLLLGREWPAPEADLREGEALCEELGLGDLVRRMPAGMMQRVGETGWQLSHGERSRLFLARALLQRAELTVMDESFAALDPETLDRCLRCVMRRASTLVVIAHP